MKNLIFTLSLFVSITFTFAQGEFNIWHFGYNAGLDFNGGIPVALAGGQTMQQEGVATISDAGGNLLFYTDGMTVWNRNHIMMPDGFGLAGNSSSTQSALIVPQPGSSNIYYIFTTTTSGGAAMYSIVDMNLDGGLGDITTKNALLHSSSTEKLMAVRHGNGTDFWVLIHQPSSNVFMAYLFDDTGVNTPGVSSAVGSTHSGGSGHSGYMKSSHDGQRLALAVRILELVEIFDFDNTSGVVSNAITIPSYNNTYGLEFSLDGTKLYNTIEILNQLIQYDLTAGTAADIANSEIVLATLSGGYGHGLQMAPDGKIYVAQYQQNYLGVINFPDAPGFACGFVDNAVSLGSGQCRVALPNVVNSILPLGVNFDFANICFGDTTIFTISQSGVLDSVRWCFGDTASGLANTSTSSQPGHVFTAPGSYLVELIVYSDGSVDTISNTVDIQNAVALNLGNDTSLCPGDTLLLDAYFPGATYLWHDGDASAMYTVTEQGTYWVTVTGACNAVTDSINIDLPPAISVDLGNDTIVCEGEIVSIDATTSGVDYLWQDGSTDPIYFAALPGAYIVEVSNDCQTGTDTLNVGHLPVPIVYLGNDTVLCGQHNLTLDAENPGSTYEWFNGTNTQMVSVTTTGTYYVAVTNPDGCVGYDTIDIGFEMPPLVSLGSDTTIVDGSTLVLDAGPGFTYEWSTGETAQQITVDSAGTYTVIITDENGCTDVDHIQVDVVSSIAENSLVGQISVYPSLVSDFVMVDFKSSTTGRAEIQVFNMNGVSLFQREVEASALQFSIDFGHFPSGMYIVKVSLETGALMEKVVKIR